MTAAAKSIRSKFGRSKFGRSKSGRSKPAKKPLAKKSNRRRIIVTPEGLALPITIASISARAGALILDLVIIIAFFIALVLLSNALGLGASASLDSLDSSQISPAVELITVIFIMAVFLARYGYFMAFELGPKGATPGKNLVGIRVASRDGGQLTTQAVIARNLLRDVEVVLPLVYLLTMEGGGIAGVAGAAWLGIFLLFPCFNKDNLRAGDLVGGTWVVELENRKLPEAMSLAPDHSSQYRFGPEELSIYGEHELQVLEDVLRKDNPDIQREVVEAICKKIGWNAGAGDERQFLEGFYEALRAHLESGMRFGKRKKNKFHKG